MSGEMMEMRVGGVIIPLSCKIYDDEKDNAREKCPALYFENGKRCCLFAKDAKTPTKIIDEIKVCPLVNNQFVIIIRWYLHVGKRYPITISIPNFQKIS